MASGEEVQIEEAMQLITQPSYEEVLTEAVERVWARLQEGVEQGKKGIVIDVKGGDGDVDRLCSMLHAKDTTLRFKQWNANFMGVAILRKLIVYWEPIQPPTEPADSGESADAEALLDSTCDQNS